MANRTRNLIVGVATQVQKDSIRQTENAINNLIKTAEANPVHVHFDMSEIENMSHDLDKIFSDFRAMQKSLKLDTGVIRDFKGLRESIVDTLKYLDTLNKTVIAPENSNSGYIQTSLIGFEKLITLMGGLKATTRDFWDPEKTKITGLLPTLEKISGLLDSIAEKLQIEKMRSLDEINKDLVEQKGLWEENTKALDEYRKSLLESYSGKAKTDSGKLKNQVKELTAYFNGTGNANVQRAFNDTLSASSGGIGKFAEHLSAAMALTEEQLGKIQIKVGDTTRTLLELTQTDALKKLAQEVEPAIQKYANLQNELTETKNRQKELYKELNKIPLGSEYDSKRSPIFEQLNEIEGKENEVVGKLQIIKESLKEVKPDERLGRLFGAELINNIEKATEAEAKLNAENEKAKGYYSRGFAIEPASIQALKDAISSIGTLNASIGEDTVLGFKQEQIEQITTAFEGLKTVITEIGNFFKSGTEGKSVFGINQGQLDDIIKRLEDLKSVIDGINNSLSNSTASSSLETIANGMSAISGALGENKTIGFNEEQIKSITDAFGNLQRMLNDIQLTVRNLDFFKFAKKLSAGQLEQVFEYVNSKMKDVVKTQEELQQKTAQTRQLFEEPSGQMSLFDYVIEDVKQTEEELKQLPALVNQWDQTWKEAAIQLGMEECRKAQEQLNQQLEAGTRYAEEEAKVIRELADAAMGVGKAPKKGEIVPAGYWSNEYKNAYDNGVKKALTTDVSNLAAVNEIKLATQEMENMRKAAMEGSQVLREYSQAFEQVGTEAARFIEGVRGNFESVDYAEIFEAQMDEIEGSVEKLNQATTAEAVNNLKNKYTEASQAAEGFSQAEQQVANTGEGLEQVVKKQIKSIESLIASMSSKGLTPKWSEQFTPIVTEFENLVTQMKSGAGAIDFNNLLGQFANIKAALEGIQQEWKEVEGATQKAASSVDIDNLMARMQAFLKNNKKLSDSTRTAISSLMNSIKPGILSPELAEIAKQFTNIQNRARAAGETGRTVFDIWKSGLTNLARYLSTFASFYRIVGYVRSAITTIKDLDYALVDLRKTTTMSSSALEEFYMSASETARNLGVTTKEIIDQAAAWSRLGYSSKEAATEMAALSSQFAQISPGMDISKATDGLVSSMKAFHVEVDNVERDVMDNVNKIGNTLATTNEEIVDMLTRSSAAMSAANNSIKETIALESAAVQITRNAETTGTAFRTISMRIRGLDEETEGAIEDFEVLQGKIADLTKTAKTPGGISLFTDETKETYKSTYQLLKEISDIYDELSDKNQAELLEVLAGKRGGQVLAGILGPENFKEVERAMQNMEEAAGSADAEMSIVEESITYKVNRLKETWVGTLQSIVDRGDLGKIVDNLTSLSEGIGSLVKNIGLVKTLFATLGAIIGGSAIKNFGKPKRRVSYIVPKLKNSLLIGSFRLKVA